MKIFPIVLITLFVSNLCRAQVSFESIRNSDMRTLYIDSATYSETTTAIKLKNNNIMVGGFYRKADNNRRSCILLFNASGQSLKNGYHEGFLSFNLYDDKENFVSDLANAGDGGVYMLGTTAKSNYYTGYLSKMSSNAEIDESFSIPGSEDTGFVNIHNYKMVKPNTENQFQELNDTTYSEPKRILIQKDGKIVIAAVTRKQTTEVGYEDGESYVVRLFRDGTIDSSFGVDGIAHINLSIGCDDVNTATLDDNDRIVLFGKYNHDYRSGIVEASKQAYVTRLTNDGKMDKTFGEEGVYIFSYPDSKLRPVKILESNNHSLLFFSNIQIEKSDKHFSYGLNIFKLNDDGLLDTKFHQKGTFNIFKMGIGFTNDIQLTPDNKYIVSGTNQNLVKDHMDGDEEILFSNNEGNSDLKEYTEEELNQESAIGFTMRLDADCNIDSTFPKNGLYFTSYENKARKLFFSNTLILDKNQIITFGANETEVMPNSMGFLVCRIITDLNFGEIACKKDVGLSFYPNPIKDFANIEFDLCQAEQVSAYLYNMSGQLVKTLFENKSFDKGHIKEHLQFDAISVPGTYILQLRGKNFTKSVKVIKN